jgi:hypothetical protein
MRERTRLAVTVLVFQINIWINIRKKPISYLRPSYGAPCWKRGRVYHLAAMPYADVPA